MPKNSLPTTTLVGIDPAQQGEADPRHDQGLSAR
jgi:hypothetical protein